MDTILGGIFQSDLEPRIKHALVNKFIPAASSEEATQNCLKILKICWEKLLNSNVEFEKQTCCKLWLAWTTHNKTCAESFLTSELLEETFRNIDTINMSELFSTVTVGLKVLPETDFLKSCSHIFERHLNNFLDRQFTLKENSAMAELFTILQLKTDSMLTLTKHYLKFMWTLPSAKSETDENYIQTNLCAQMIGKFCQLNNNCLNLSLLQLWYYLSTPESNCSPCLASVFEVLPQSSMEEITKVLTNVKPEDLYFPLNRLISMLEWPMLLSLPLWIMYLLKTLGPALINNLQIFFYQAKIVEVCKFLLTPSTCEAAYKVFSHMLLTYHYSPKLFHIIIPEIETVMNALKEKPVLQTKLAEVFYTLMLWHNGFDKIYEPVREILKDYSPPSIQRGNELISEASDFDDSFSERCSLDIRPRIMTDRTSYVGLNNLGNTCYVNCAIQALFMTKSFRKSILQYNPETNETWMQILQETFAFLQLSSKHSYYPRNVTVATKPQLFLGLQQDSSEYLRHLLSNLDEKLTSIIKKKKEASKGDQDDFSHGEDLKPSNLESNNSSNNESANDIVSLVEDNFGGTLINNIQFLECGHKTTCKEKFYNISLPIPKHHQEKVNGTNPTLNHLLHEYFQPEMLDNDNKVECSNCKLLQATNKLVTMDISPQHLIITLLRFEYDNSSSTVRKVMTEIDVPKTLESPDLGGIYHLYAFIVHKGDSPSCGHYVTMAKCSSESAELQHWFLFNDSLVKKAEDNDLEFLNTAYLLFYSKETTENTTIDLSNLNQELLENIYSDNAQYLKVRISRALNSKRLKRN